MKQLKKLLEETKVSIQQLEERLKADPHDYEGEYVIVLMPNVVSNIIVEVKNGKVFVSYYWGNEEKPHFLEQPIKRTSRK